MRPLSDAEKRLVEDLLTHEGWKIVVADLKEKERMELEGLVNADPGEVSRAQNYIRAIRDVLERPKRLIREVV